MQLSHVISFADAAVAWICDRDSRLSVSTERAYRGEINRMAQFFAMKYGGLALGEFTQKQWEDYVGELQGVRQHVVTCRDEALSPSSAAQAIRICTAFLRWSRDEGLLSWAPKMPSTFGGRKAEPNSRRPLVDLSADAEPLHPALEALLIKAPESEATQDVLRAQLAIGLAYWGGLRSSEIAALRCGDIATKGNTVELHHPRLDSVITILGNVAATWHQYCVVREEAGDVLTRKSPVVAALCSNEPISAWSVWALIAQYVEIVTGVEKLYSAQSLRRSRVTAMGARCAPDIDELSKYTHRCLVDFAPSVRNRSPMSRNPVLRAIQSGE
ncbi:hypothetical protein [Acidovorax sp. BLS4]|uniref:tyrosine-type recombinase/integrase n=1 Tax=Acidovorax sp. BLS4 TaxID=3273430 RepID=UPI002942E4A2|nr:hypothetical protein [Paracidovorax avenae]WOI46505.1 hypothetical protein R1Z03_04620 [Paracidovorax avenae]